MNYLDKYMAEAERLVGRNALYAAAEAQLGAGKVSIPEGWEELEVFGDTAEEFIMVAMEQYDLGFQCEDCGWICWEHDKSGVGHGYICNDCAEGY